jgi:class 3 adenylate cyclase
MTYWGTDAGEFVDDPDQLARYIRAAFSDETMGSWGAPPYRIDAWADGRLGWSTTHSTIRFPPGAQELRGTLVFRLELDEWKIVHEHWSFGASEEIYGYPAGSTLDLISQAAQEERPDLRPWTAQDGTTTLVFTDIEGSTALNAAFGDQAWLEVLRVHNQIVEREVRNHGGAVVKGQGDGFMLAFASARRALSCAEAIQRAMQEAFTDPGSPIRVRIGVHTGEVIREANDFFGHAVNYAARVASHAKGGQILVSTIVHDLVEPSRAFSFEMPQQVELKGIDGPVRLWRLGPRIGRRPRPGRRP